MTIFDTLAERHIQAALESGELQGLAGEGKPLTLDDDSHVPPELRVGYRLLKNAGYLPPALLARQEAVSLAELLSALPPDSAEYEQTGCWHYRCSRRGSIRIFCITVTMTPYNRH